MALMTATQTLHEEIERLTAVVGKLSSSPDTAHKKKCLEMDPFVVEAVRESLGLQKVIPLLTESEAFMFLSLIACRQVEHLFTEEQLVNETALKSFLEQLIPVDQFYEEMGGLIGYHLSLLRLIEEKKETTGFSSGNLFAPKGIDISEENDEVRSFILSGIKSLPFMAEIYPVGGAADRLDLRDSETGAALPAARLEFLGRTLLEGLIRDLQAREYIYFKLFHDQLTTPIVLMTSHEKRNHAVVENILVENDFFHRPEESFFSYPQLSVPTISEEGKWCLEAPFKLLTKPGGHGVIWKLAKDKGAFEWLLNQGYTKAVVRQVNNPIASTDYGILAFIGLGAAKNKKFGFASCERMVGTAEGMNVVVEKKLKVGYEYCLTNIEYCDFKKYQIEDKPASPGGIYSAFPSNTNILFADIQAVSDILELNPLPGALVNFKKSSVVSAQGEVEEKSVARLESAMQNIADSFTQFSSKKASEGETEALQVFLTTNHRKKTISTVKRSYAASESLLETPDGCFLDLQVNCLDLLTKYCEVTINRGRRKSFLPLVMYFHPALGPMYSVIAQKLHHGIIQEGSELSLEIAELYLKDFKLEGSLKIEAKKPLGHIEGHLIYSERVGRCYLENVTIKNKGIDKERTRHYWKNEIVHHESCSIILHGMSEFYAKDVAFEGNLCIEVEDGYRLTAVQKKGEIEWIKEKISEPSWHWDYEIGERQQVKLILKKPS